VSLDNIEVDQMDEIHRVSPEYIAKTLQEAGYLGKVENAGESVYVHTAAEGWGLNIRFYNDIPQNAEQECESLQFWSFWPLTDETQDTVCRVANEFNCDMRYATAFVRRSDDKHWAEITMDHIASDGITAKTVVRMLELFVDLRRAFYQRSKEACTAGEDPASANEGSDREEGKPTTH
jgi:Putative bacterial sensory transduction regulator